VEKEIFIVLIPTMNGVHSGWNSLETMRWQFDAWPTNRGKCRSSGDCPTPDGCALLNRLAKTSELPGNFCTDEDVASGHWRKAESGHQESRRERTPIRLHGSG
jgi:hypothetical protein